ncbi:MAG TPA: hypothetical protein VFN35_12860, partial [Ktedonobacteraceae bacterium]|nr:hypothetical protein [Ktedonobacteraceae bacterium]
IEIFPDGLGMSESLGELPVLCTIPLLPPVANSGDNGQPIVVSSPDSAASLAFYALAERIMHRLHDTGEMFPAEEQIDEDDKA